MWIFRERAVDYAILEVGLGGRMDAVNLWDADVALITSIGIDHTEWLGRTREAIGREKAGIMRPGQRLSAENPSPPSACRIRRTGWARNCSVLAWTTLRNPSARTAGATATATA